MEDKFLVIEIQRNGDQVANLVTAHDTLLQAQAKFHTVALAATASNVERHSVAILNDWGYCLENAHFDRSEPTPEEE